MNVVIFPFSRRLHVAAEALQMAWAAPSRARNSCEDASEQRNVASFVGADAAHGFERLLSSRDSLEILSRFFETPRLEIRKETMARSVRVVSWLFQNTHHKVPESETRDERYF